MKKSIKLILILLIVSILGAAIIITCYHSSKVMQDNTEQVETSHWVNGGGDITESVKSDPSYFTRMKQEIIDSVTLAYKTTPKKIVEYITIHEQGESDIPQSGSTAADYFSVDTSKNCPPQIKSLTADFVTPYDSMHVKIAAPGSGDTSMMHKSSKDTLSMVAKWVTEGNLFNRRKKLQFDFSNANPDNKIYIDHVYRITEKPKKWGVGAQAGVGFFGSLKPTPYLGLGVSYTPIRF